MKKKEYVIFFNLILINKEKKLKKVVKSKILEGKSAEALEIIKHSFPALLKDFPKLEFLLTVQHFIEMINVKDYAGAITFMKNISIFTTNELFMSIRENKIEEISLEV